MCTKNCGAGCCRYQGGGGRSQGGGHQQYGGYSRQGSGYLWGSDTQRQGQASKKRALQ